MLGILVLQQRFENRRHHLLPLALLPLHLHTQPQEQSLTALLTPTKQSSYPPAYIVGESPPSFE